MLLFDLTQGASTLREAPLNAARARLQAQRRTLSQTRIGRQAPASWIACSGAGREMISRLAPPGAPPSAARDVIDLSSGADPGG